MAARDSGSGAPPLAGWARDFAGFGLLALLAFCAGLLLNQVRSHPLPLAYAPVDAEAPLGTAAATVELPAFQQFVASGEWAIVDARPAAFYRLGHVPGAINLPRGELGKYGRGLALRDKARFVAVYCSGPDCEDSAAVAAALLSSGYKRVVVFKGGWEAWKAAGLPAEPGR